MLCLDGVTLAMGTNNGEIVTFNLSESSNPTFMLKELDKFHLPCQG